MPWSLHRSLDGGAFEPVGPAPSADRCKTVARDLHREAVGRSRFRIFDPADRLAFFCDGRHPKMDWRWGDLTARTVLDARDRAGGATWRPEPGDVVWFLKSMRLVRIVEALPDDRFDVERVDNGKALYATLDGLAPREAFQEVE